MVSITSGDLNEHQDALIKIIHAAELHDDEARENENQLALRLELRDRSSVCAALCDLSGLWIRRNRLARAERCLRIASDVAVLAEDERALVAVRFARFEELNDPCALGGSRMSLGNAYVNGAAVASRIL